MLNACAMWAIGLVLAIGALASAPACAQPTVTIEGGVIAGAEADGVESFKGVPFAAPPVGEFRWRAPQPVAPWRGVRQATVDGDDCEQTPFPGNAAPLDAPLSEDCLYLNVWRPRRAESVARLPVLVWIHGGGFVNGGASPAVFSGESFARKGVIMVGVNYRVGRFGFFGFPALTAENKDGGRLGNYGYMDMIASLEWVQRNIPSFGGDPRNVTIFGESAGGASVQMLLTSPLARGLFSRAIIQSGGGRRNLMGDRMVREDRPGFPSLETVGAAFARQHGINGVDAAALAQLRALPASAIDGGLHMGATAEQQRLGIYGGPAIDGTIVVASPEEFYRSGRQIAAPVIIGATSADLGFLGVAGKEEAFGLFGQSAAAARAAYDPHGDRELREVLAQIAGDRTMVEPARFVARELARHSVPTYQFRFSYVAASMRSQWRQGAPHASDVPYVMNTVAAKYGTRLSATDAAIADQMNSYWANFAKTGDPNGPGLPRWPQYDSRRDIIMDFGADGRARAVRDPWRTRLDLVASISE